MVWVGRALCGSPSPTPCRSRGTQSRLHRTLSRQVLSISREGDSTAPLGSLKQPLETCRKMGHLQVVYSELLALHAETLISSSCFGWWHLPASPVPMAGFSFSGACLVLAVTHLLPDPISAKPVLSKSYVCPWLFLFCLVVP